MGIKTEILLKFIQYINQLIIEAELYIHIALLSIRSVFLNNSYNVSTFSEKDVNSNYY